MSAAYSKRFIGQRVSLQDAEPRDVTTTVPAGRVWVVRSIDAFSASATALWVGVYTTPSFAFLFYQQVGGGKDQATWTGRQVLVAGEQLIATIPAGASCMVSGYELTA